MAKKTAKIIHK